MESAKLEAPQPATAIASHRVHPDKIADYMATQNRLTNAARAFAGFVGTEVRRPVAGLQEEWIVIFRLESNQAMQQWLENPQRLQLVSEINDFLSEPSRLLVLAGNDNREPPAAMLFAHRVAPQKVEDYLAWRRRVIAAQSRFPGYLETEFFQPQGKAHDEWVDIVRYNSQAELDNWLESRERQDLLDELQSIAASVQSRRVTGLESWFALRRPGEPADAPPSWKQAAAVLFALYPTVMILTYLDPLLGNLSLAVRMLISNILSVALLTWLLMPKVTEFLGFWSSPTQHNRANEVLGIGAVGFGLVLMVFLFRLFGSMLSLRIFPGIIGFSRPNHSATLNANNSSPGGDFMSRSWKKRAPSRRDSLNRARSLESELGCCRSSAQPTQ